MIRPVAALMTTAAVSILGPISAATAMHPATDPPTTQASPHLATQSPAQSSAQSPPESAVSARSERAEAARDATRAATRRAEAQDPMPVTIDSVSPSVIPRSGPIKLSGRVTNDTDDEARDVNIHPLTSESPMTTTEEITAATEADPGVYWGDRITDIGSFATIAHLDPGETKRWKITVPQTSLQISGTQGVYQIGVHVRAPGEDSADRVTYGRDRTLIPLIDRSSPSVRTSIVVPLRELVARNAEGRLEGAQEWERELSSGGRLRNIADFAAHSEKAPLTWLIDPAVIEAVQQISEGNPARNLDPTDGEEPKIESTEPELRGGSSAADTWLGDLSDTTSGREVLALPYGDLDVAAAFHHDSPLYPRARKMSTRVFSDLGIQSRPTVAPVSGLLPTGAFDLIDDATDVLLSSDAIPAREDVSKADTPSYLQVDGHRVAVHDADAAATPSRMAKAAGGLDIAVEQEPPSAVSVRQRVLSEAAVRSLSGSTESLVVNLPADFDPGRHSKRFFTGLGRSFIDVVALSGNRAGTAHREKELAYPSHEERAELPVNAFLNAKALADAGAALDGVLTRTDQVDRQVAAQALTSVSQATRGDTDAAQFRASAATSWIDGSLDKITIEAPSFVILSAESGPFAATVTNGLDQPVTVAIEARTPKGVSIEAPESVHLEANASRTVPLTAHTEDIGVHSVELRATDEAGNPIGTADRLSIRSNAVGKVIWVILGVGVGILFVAIPLRWIRRIRARRQKSDAGE